jgi:hypothetical protein
VTQVLLPSLPEPARVLTQRGAGLEPLSRALVQGCGDPGADAFDLLAERQVLVRGPDGCARVVPLVAAVVGQRPDTEADRAWLLRRAIHKGGGTNTSANA